MGNIVGSSEMSPASSSDIGPSSPSASKEKHSNLPAKASKYSDGALMESCLPNLENGDCITRLPERNVRGN